MAVILADEEKQLHKAINFKLNFTHLYRATNINMSWHMKLKDLRTIVRSAIAGEAYGISDVQVVIDRVVTR